MNWPVGRYPAPAAELGPLDDGGSCNSSGVRKIPWLSRCARYFGSSRACWARSALSCRSTFSGSGSGGKLGPLGISIAISSLLQRSTNGLEQWPLSIGSLTGGLLWYD